MDQILDMRQLWQPDPKDVVTCVCCGLKFIYVGTLSGKIIKLTRGGTKLIESHCHSARVTGIIVDENETALASIGLDGKLLVKPLVEDFFDDMENRLAHGPLTAICFGSKFSISKFSFYLGSMTGKFVLFEQGWLAPKETVLSEHSKPITAIVLYKKYLSYSDTSTVYVLNKFTREIISAIPRPKIPENILQRAELDITPTIVWEGGEDSNKYTLYVSWYNVIRIFTIEDGISEEDLCIVQSKYYIESSLYHCGITLFTNRLLLYGIETGLSGRNNHVIKILSKKNESLYEQFVNEGVESALEPWQYKCCFWETDTDFLVYSPGLIVLMNPITVCEKLARFKEKHKYEECLKITTEFSEELSPEIVDKIETEYIEHLLVEHRYTEAINRIKSMKTISEERWVDWIQKFRGLDKLDLILEALLDSNVKLRKGTYEVFPQYFLTENQFDKLEDSITKLADKVNLNKVLSMINAKMASDKSLFLVPQLQRSRLKIAKAIDNAELAVPLCIQLKDLDIFNIITHHKEIRIPPLVLSLTEIDPTATVKLVRSRRELKASQLVPYLKTNEKSLFSFLDSAFTLDPEYIAEFQPLLPELYIKYSPGKLLAFLKASTGYNVVDTLKLCKEKGLLPELVFLHDKLGDKKAALTCLLGQIKGDVKEACKYVVERDAVNQELWDIILEECKGDSKKLAELFEYLEFFDNPEEILNKPELNIELQEVRKELQNSLDQMQIKENIYKAGCQIAAADLMKAMKKYIEFRRKGYQLKKECAVCHKRLIFMTKAAKKDLNDGLLIFFCGHHIHSRCYQLKSSDGDAPKFLCPVCGGVCLTQG